MLGLDKRYAEYRDGKRNAPPTDDSFFRYNESISEKKITEWIEKIKVYLKKYKEGNIPFRLIDLCPIITQHLASCMMMAEGKGIKPEEAAKLILIAQAREKECMMAAEYQDFYRDLDNYKEGYGEGQNTPNSTFNDIEGTLCKRLKKINEKAPYVKNSSVFDEMQTSNPENCGGPTWVTINFTQDSNIQNIVDDSNKWMKILPEEYRPRIEQHTIALNELNGIFVRHRPSHMTMYSHGTPEDTFPSDQILAQAGITSTRFSEPYQPWISHGIAGTIDTNLPEDTPERQSELRRVFGWTPSKKVDVVIKNETVAEMFATCTTLESLLIFGCDSGTLGVEILKKHPSIKKIICFDGSLPVELARILEPILHFLIWATQDKNFLDTQEIFLKSLREKKTDSTNYKKNLMKRTIGVVLIEKACKFAEKNLDIVPQWMDPENSNLQPDQFLERLLDHLVLLQKN